MGQGLPKLLPGWTEEEARRLLTGLREHGTETLDWMQTLLPGKDPEKVLKEIQSLRLRGLVNIAHFGLTTIQRGPKEFIIGQERRQALEQQQQQQQQVQQIQTRHSNYFYRCWDSDDDESSVSEDDDDDDYYRERLSYSRALPLATHACVGSDSSSSSSEEEEEEEDWYWEFIKRTGHDLHTAIGETEGHPVLCYVYCLEMSIRKRALARTGTSAGEEGQAYFEDVVSSFQIVLRRLSKTRGDAKKRMVAEMKEAFEWREKHKDEEDAFECWDRYVEKYGHESKYHKKNLRGTEKRRRAPPEDRTEAFEKLMRGTTQEQRPKAEPEPEPEPEPEAEEAEAEVGSKRRRFATLLPATCAWLERNNLTPQKVQERYQSSPDSLLSFLEAQGLPDTEMGLLLGM